MGNGTPHLPVDAIVFDYGGVLAEEGFREGLKALALRFGLDAEKMYEEGSRAVYDSGYVLNRGTEADFWALLSARTGLPSYDASFTREILKRFVLRPSVVRTAKWLRGEGFLTAILSDQTDWLDHLNERDHFFQHFDRVFNSYYLGKGKRDPSIFRDVAAILKLAPERTLFIDDSPGNVGRALEQGIKAFTFEGEEDFRVQLQDFIGRELPGTEE
jgi:putative hydrolase of the HAD superfamily